MAEGVVSEPLLPSGDQGHKVGFTPPTSSLSKNLIAYRLRNKMAKNILAMKLGVGLGTLKNWEFGRIHPNRKSWPAIRTLLGL